MERLSRPGKIIYGVIHTLEGRGSIRAVLDHAGALGRTEVGGSFRKTKEIFGNLIWLTVYSHRLLLVVL